MMENRIIRNEILCAMARRGQRHLPAAVSARHVHLRKEHADILFGPGYVMQKTKDLSQPGQYACRETVSVQGSRGTIHHVRILAPTRTETQVEVSVTDSYTLGVNPVVRMSGDTAGTPGCTLIGPAGRVEIDSGLIVSHRHLHISKEQAEAYGLQNGDVICARCGGRRATVIENIAVRSGDGHDLEIHLDTDEANAAMLKSGDLLEIVSTGLQTAKDTAESARGMNERKTVRPDEAATLVLLASRTAGDRDAMAALRERFSGKLIFAPAGGAFEAADQNTVFTDVKEMKSLLAIAAQSDDVVLLAPGISQLENIAYGREGGLCEEVLLRSMLWGKKVHILLDFVPPRFKRGTLFEKICDALTALNDMGVSILTYSCVPLRPEPLTLVTENDVTEAHRDGKNRILCAQGAIVTPSARDKAKELNMQIDWQG